MISDDSDFFSTKFSTNETNFQRVCGKATGYLNKDSPVMNKAGIEVQKQR